MSSDGIKWQSVEGEVRMKIKIIGKEKTQTAGCAEHMKQRNYAEQRELKSLSYFGIG